MKFVLHATLLPFIFLVISPLKSQDLNNSSSQHRLEQRKNTTFNIEELKVRWKKAALENCPFSPCIIAPPPPSFSCGNSTITDLDGNIYNTVSIGTQCWMKENLRVTKYTNGSPITLDNSGGSNGFTNPQTWTTQTTGAITMYKNSPDSLVKYGYLYNRFTFTGGRSVCPNGWHVPTPDEWYVLVKFLEPSNVYGPNLGTVSSTVGGKLKMTGDTWNYYLFGGANNSTGFSALPGGFREKFFGGVGGGQPGEFRLVNEITHFWAGGSTRRYVILEASAPSLQLANGQDDQAGHSIRCIKDSETGAY